MTYAPFLFHFLLTSFYLKYNSAELSCQVNIHEKLIFTGFSGFFTDGDL